MALVGSYIVYDTDRNKPKVVKKNVYIQIGTHWNMNPEHAAQQAMCYAVGPGFKRRRCLYVTLLFPPHSMILALLMSVLE